MIDILAHYLLKFGHQTFIMPIIVLSMIFHKREPYAKAACLFCIIMIFNTLLKNVFKVPLMSHLGTGYAFPSGHMHAATVFYGYILYKTDNYVIKFLLACIICGLAFALIYHNYHHLPDIVGSVAFAVIELLICKELETKFGNVENAIIAILFSIASIAIIWSMINIIDFHIWIASYVMLGFMIGCAIFPNKPLSDYIQKVSAILLFVALWYIIDFLHKSYGFSYSSDYYIVYLKYLFVPIAITSSIFIASFISRSSSSHQKSRKVA